MRGIGNHTPPAQYQPVPLDNTSDYVRAQVLMWARGSDTDMLIHPEIAREIAAWWAMPNNALATFATTGRITDQLAEDIAEELQELLASREETDLRDHDALMALLAYVRAARDD
jgi:hypothetical protein